MKSGLAHVRSLKTLPKGHSGVRFAPKTWTSLCRFLSVVWQKHGFDRGIEQVVAAVLANPWFLYRGVTPEAGDEAALFCSG